MNRIIALIIALAILGFAAASTLLIVEQGDVAVLTSGHDAPRLLEAGLHLKAPAPFATVTRLDTRVQTLQPADPVDCPAADRASLLVTPVLAYRIDDPLKFYAAGNGDSDAVVARLATALRGAVSAAVARHSFGAALAGENDVSAQALQAIQQPAAALGVQALDVRFARVDLPVGAADAAYKRMSAAQQQLAEQTRAAGAAQADRIKADADRERQTILADANRAAQAVKGQADAQATMLAADAYKRDPQFYQFYASLEAYRKTFKPNDVIVVDPDNEFFRFMRNPAAASGAAAAAPARKH